MKIASFDEPRPRGLVIGKQVTGPRLTEAENYCQCIGAADGLMPAISYGSRITRDHCRTRHNRQAAFARNISH
jgi:hypothetical protein